MFRMTCPIVYFFVRWSMCGEFGLFSSLAGAEGGIYSCDGNSAQVKLLFLSLSPGIKIFSCLRA